MDSTDLAALRRRARMRYELVRARRALLGTAPVLVIVGLAAIFGHRLSTALGFGAATLVASAAMLFYGRAPQRAVFPGVAAGLFPLVFALCASHYHHCGPTACSTLCVPACAVGGLLAGLIVAGNAHRRRANAAFWLSAASLTLLTGAMGCGCIGYGGMLGLGAGFAVGVVPLLMRRLVEG